MGINHMPPKQILIKPTVQFQTGRKYARKKDIHLQFGGGFQSGISPSRVVDAIFLFTGESGEKYGYKDTQSVDESGNILFSYTGEGQIGDMVFTKGNKAVRDHSEAGRALHLFRSLGKRKSCEYLGEFVYASHEIKDGKDREGNDRKLIIFLLVSVKTAENLESNDAFDDVIYVPKSIEEARRLAIAASTTAGRSTGQSAIRTLYARSKAVKTYVLMRSEGICELCAEPAPFERANGTPYLEPHHTTRLTDGGADHPKFVGAICPACHREIHYGKNGASKNDKLRGFLLAKESK
jgi:5-methylcytosine-specific restriction protein A